MQSPIKDLDNAYMVSQEKVKELINAFKDTLSTGEAKEVLAIAGEVSTVTKAAKVVVDVKNWHMTRKIRKFALSLEAQHLDKEQFNALIGQYGEENVYRNIILSLDVMRSEKQASAFACLFAALLKEDLEWKRFSELQNILEKLDPSALDEDFCGKKPSHKLVTVGLAYVTTIYNGVDVRTNGKLYNDFENYIVKPYRAEKDREYAQ